MPDKGSTAEIELALSDGGAAAACTVTVKRRAGTKRLTLRVCPKRGTPSVTAPPIASDKDIERFLSRHSDWLLKQLKQQAPAIIVEDGALVPFKGEETRLVLTGRSPRTVFHADDQLVIGGPVDLAAGRLDAFFKAQARETLRSHVEFFSTHLGVSPRSISIRDTVSRWGSCSSRGTLNFSWRLILAPDWVMRYVAAHEVCHLLEMNHSPRFWSHVASVYPDWGEAKSWLKKEGNALMQIRFASARLDQTDLD